MYFVKKKKKKKKKGVMVHNQIKGSSIDLYAKACRTNILNIG
jgi:hypothetical protein